MSVIITNNGIIHDTVKILGSGIVIVEYGAQIRHFSVIEMDTGYFHIRRDSILGYNSMVQATGIINIGINTLLGPHCVLLASYHQESFDPQIQKKLVRSELTIGNNVWSGANVVFNYGITVYDNSIIGANSFVNKTVDYGTVVAGSPAKFIRNKIEIK
jgi:acetyltransferase-like isoleucine patch superfamily enzyme